MNITELLFMSHNDSLFTQIEDVPDIIIRRIPLPFDRSSVTSFLAGAGETSIAFLDLQAADQSLSEFTIDLCRTQGARTITFSPEFDAGLKKFLLRNGVADIYNERSFKYFGPFISLLRERRSSDTAGTIIILDDDPRITGILKSILKRFSYMPVITSSLQEFFEALPLHTPSLILMGLSTKKFDIQAFVKTAHGNPSVRRAPLIAYKKPDDGIYVHELVSGINRYTKVILSPEELYSLLLHIMFRREIAPYMGTLSSTLDISSFSMLYNAPLSQMYYNLGVDLCSAEYIFTEEKITHLHDVLGKIHAAIVKAESIKWLAGNNETRTTCATYV